MNTTDEQLPERTGYLVLLATGPTIFAAHFLMTYVTAAVYCARFAGPHGSLAAVRPAIAIATAAAVIAIGLIAWGGYRRHRFGESSLPHDFDSPADRHRFLGFATFLLASLSAFATILVAASTMFFSTCE